MKRVKDVGLQHIIKLGISAGKHENAVYNTLSRKYGEFKAREILDSHSGNIGEGMAYDEKNATYELGMLISGTYDADIIRQACNWVYSHKESFEGETILEVGCDCGFMTTFLGSIFPE